MTKDSVTDLARLLDVETLDRDLFRGPVKPGATGRVFGGQVVAQAFMAAQRAIDDDKVAHSFHAYFLRPGSEKRPIMLRVERDFDGGSFANRRVIATQDGAALLTLTASFQRPEQGLSYAASMPDVAPPEACASIVDLAHRADAPLVDSARAFLLQPSAFEMRPIGDLCYVQRHAVAPAGAIWFRLREPAPVDPAMARAILAYVSDFSLLITALNPHGRNMFDDPLQSASLDHAVWFHDIVPLDDWLLYATDSAWSGAGRGHARGAIYTRGGRLVAQTTQEGLIRLRPDKPPGVTFPHIP